LPAQSAPSPAVTTIAQVKTVAAGMFAPGHLGELTQVVPFELIDSVLTDTGTAEQKLRMLPSRVGMYFLLAMCLFPEVGYGGVWAKLTGGLQGLALPTPTVKALRDLRRRLGPAPARALFGLLAGPLAQPTTPGIRFGRWRTVSFDGCTSQKVPDTDRNRAWLGKDAKAGYPRIELMTLVETGTRGLLGAVFGPTAEGETSYARQLLGLLDDTMLVLWDRGFDADDFMAAVARTGAAFLGRCKSNRRLPVLARLHDGSYRSRIGDLTVRIIEAVVTVTCADGTRFTGTYRLATTLLDPRRYPARALIALYHERWEHEVAYLALRDTILDGRILRSKDPAGLRQEMWALLALYQIIRTAMVAAVESVPGTDPDRASFTTALTAARDLLVQAAGVVTDTVDLVGTIGRQILANLMPDRRPRVSTRKVKSPLARYAARQADGRPLNSQNVTGLTTAVRDPTGTTHPTPNSTPLIGNQQSDARQPQKPRRRHPQVLTTAGGP
jgi:hypothetical protein